MLIITVPHGNDKAIEDITNEFEIAEVVKVDALDADTVTQVIIPILTVSIPSVTSIIIKILSIHSDLEVEYKGTKIKGTPKQVEKLLRKLIRQENKRNSERRD